MSAWDKIIDIVRVLPWSDWLALLVFFVVWIGYAWFASQGARTQATVLGASNRERALWMREAALRENRVLDGIVTQSLSASPSFFASTTILIIGGLLAVLSTTDKASEFVREVPFAARTSLLVFDLKVVLLLAIFVYAFFRFTWSLRQYSFGALLVGSAPSHEHMLAHPASADAFALRAGRVMGLAAESFNDGLRGYYMAFAATAWFFSPWAMMIGSLGVVAILYRREFRSEVLEVLNLER